VNKSESIKEIAAALSKFQAEIENPKNTADNPFFKSKYAPLNDILNLARPLLAKHGLSVLQSPSGDGERIVITTMLMHLSGEWIELDPLILKADKITAQGAGSAITYGRRYALSALLGISSEDDDDGNGAEPKAKAKTQTKPAEQSVNWPAFWTGIKKLGYTEQQVYEIAKTDSLKEWTKPAVEELYRQLMKQAEKKQ
jgi:hypothetical protein